MDEKSTRNLLRNKKLLSWGAVFYGLFFFGFGFTDLNNESGIFLILFGFLLTAVGVIGVYLIRKKKSESDNDRLNTLLYQLIKKRNGKITVLEFAIHANIEPNMAREFIESKAIQLGSVPDIDENGTITYIFK